MKFLNCIRSKWYLDFGQFSAFILILLLATTTVELFAQERSRTGGKDTLGTYAQYPRDRGQPQLLDSTTISLTLGEMSTWYGYVPARIYEPRVSPDMYTFNHNVKTLMWSSDVATFSLAYGNRPSAGGERHQPGQQLFDAYLTFGGNSYLYRTSYNVSGAGRLPVSIFVPIRFNLQYRTMSLYGDFRGTRGEVISTKDHHTPTIHYGRVGLGPGLGFRLGIPFPFLEGNQLVVLTHYEVIPGLVNDLSRKGNVYMGQNKNLNVEIKLGHMIGGDIGFTLGYTQRQQFRASTIPGNFGGIISGIIGEADFLRMGSQHMLRFGINY